MDEPTWYGHGPDQCPLHPLDVRAAHEIITLHHMAGDELEEIRVYTRRYFSHWPERSNSPVPEAIIFGVRIAWTDDELDDLAIYRRYWEDAGESPIAGPLRRISHMRIAGM